MNKFTGPHLLYLKPFEKWKKVQYTIYFSAFIYGLMYMVEYYCEYLNTANVKWCRDCFWFFTANIWELALSSFVLALSACYFRIANKIESYRKCEYANEANISNMTNM